MTSVKFLADKVLYGFEISGHSSFDENDELGKIVCSAVSSAAYMATNTITEIIGDDAEIMLDEALLKVKVNNPSAETILVLKGLKLHLLELSKEYSNNIKFFGGAKNVKD